MYYVLLTASISIFFFLVLAVDARVERRRNLREDARNAVFGSCAVVVEDGTVSALVPVGADEADRTEALDYAGDLMLPTGSVRWFTTPDGSDVAEGDAA